MHLEKVAGGRRKPARGFLPAEGAKRTAGRSETTKRQRRLRPTAASVERAEVLDLLQMANFSAAHLQHILNFGCLTVGIQYGFYFIRIVKKIWRLLTNIYFCTIFFSGLIHSFT
jgi:hypothetical protein